MSATKTYTPNDNYTSAPPWVSGSFTPYGLRHPRFVAGVRFAVAALLLPLGAVMCAYGIWLGLLPFAAGLLHIWLGYRLTKTAA